MHVGKQTSLITLLQPTIWEPPPLTTRLEIRLTLFQVSPMNLLLETIRKNLQYNQIDIQLPQNKANPELASFFAVYPFSFFGNITPKISLYLLVTITTKDLTLIPGFANVRFSFDSNHKGASWCKKEKKKKPYTVWLSLPLCGHC